MTTVIINDLTLAHKGSNGTAVATLPDMCKTPSPGGPVPLPYPNIAMSADLAKGTTTIKADGGNMCANKGSELSRSTGDEAGTAGGVTSSTFIKEATWMLYSDDVFLEGKNACRLTDKLHMNHQNTVCLAGWLQNYKRANRGASDADACKALREYIEDQISDRPGEDGPSGAKTLGERMRAQRSKEGRLGGWGHPDAPIPPPLEVEVKQKKKPPTKKTITPTKNPWQTHDDAITNLKKNINDNLKEYEEECHDKGFGRNDSKKFMQRVKEKTSNETNPNPTKKEFPGRKYDVDVDGPAPPS